MFTNIMYFRISEEEKASFFEANERSWPEFFRGSEVYGGTKIVEVGENEYLTIDTWDSKEEFLDFIIKNNERFNELDRKYSFAEEVTVCALDDDRHYTHKEIDDVVNDLFGYIVEG